MDIKALLLFIIAFLNVSLAIFIYSRGTKKRVNISYSLAVLSVSLWSLSLGMVQVVESAAHAILWAKAAYLFATFIAANFLYFSLVFPYSHKPLTHRTLLFIFGFPFLLAILLGTTNFLIRGIVSQPWGREFILGAPEYLAYTLWFLVVMGWPFFHLYHKYKRSKGVERMQLRYVLFGTLASAVLGSLFSLILPWFRSQRFFWLGPLFTIVTISSVAYAIIKHRLMDIRILFARTILYSTLLIFILTAYTTIILASQRLFQDTVGSAATLVGGALLIAIGFEPLRRVFQKATDRFFYKKEFDPQQLLGDVAEAFSSIIILDKLLDFLADKLLEAYRVSHIALLLLDEEKSKSTPSFIAQRGFGNGADLSGTVSPRSLIDYFLTRPPKEYFKVPPKKEILIYEELKEEIDMGRGDSAVRSVVSEMESLDLALAVPIFRKEEFTGLILLGQKRSGEIFFDEDLRLLQIISRQAGTGVDNARLYKKVQEQMEELKETQAQQLIQSAKLASVGEMATNIAHELNNPLTSVLGFTSLLLQDIPEDDPKKRDLEIIESEALRSRDIVRNLLDFARRREPKREPSDINEVIKSTLVLIRYHAEKSNIRVEENYADDLPPTSVDVNQMKQVFINILKNAIDAMTHGGTLTITTGYNSFKSISHQLQSVVRGKTSRSPIQFTEEKARQMIEVCICDTGIGIPPCDLERIFDPFYTTKEQAMGTGLGLAVSYGIIERHEGRIEVESTEGKGSIFRIKLPAGE